MRYLFCAFLLALFINGCSPENNCNGFQNSGTFTHILFIGNSYTYVNDLPGMFSKLACSGGYQVQTGMAAQGGWSLAQHDASDQTRAALQQQKWDYIVLQEQSDFPAIPSYRAQTMYPAVRSLVARIRAAGAQPLLFMTWGHRDGDPQFGLPTYFDMQAQLSAGYMGIAQELNVPIVPVGTAWLRSRAQANLLDLWQADGSHPTEQGTYLAACVFYATIFHKSPQGLGYYAGLNKETVQTLQLLAADTVPK